MRRDMGVALGWAARDLRPPPQLARGRRDAGPSLLEAAVRDRPDDLSARESLGDDPGDPGSTRGGLQHFARGSPHDPGREWALRSSGRVLTAPPAARPRPLCVAKDDRRRPLAIDYRLKLAAIATRPAIGAKPSRLAARRSGSIPSCWRRDRCLIQCYLRSREFDKADAEFQILLRFYPASRDIWQQWYEQQKRASSGRRLRHDGPTLI